MRVDQYKREVNELLNTAKLIHRSLIRDRDAANGSLKTTLRYVNDRVEDAINELARANGELDWAVQLVEGKE